MPQASHDIAHAHFAAGRVAEAEAAWREILRRAPADVEALHTLGYILGTTGRVDEGLELLRRSIAAEPRNGGMRSNYAMVLHAAGRGNEALAQARRALELDARLPAPLILIGDLHLDAGRLDEALAAYRRALAAAPAPDAHVGIALVAWRRRHAPEAHAALQAALALDHRHAAANFNLGTLLAEEGDDAGAEAAFRRALQREPAHAAALNNLGLLYRRTGREPLARETLERALAAAPELPEVQNNAGVSLLRSGDAEGALARFTRAAQHRPGYAEALVNAGNALQDLGRLDDARGRYDEALAAAPGFPEARYGLSQVALRQRRFDAGWALYESRFETRPPFSKPRAFAVPRLDPANLDGARRVLVWSEQGLGDQVLYSTVLVELERRAIDAVLEVDARLAPAYRRRFPQWRVVAQGEAEAASADCDRQVPLASLPALFRRDAASFRGQPHALLSADATLAAATRERLGPGRWIGIGWRSFQQGERAALAARKSAPLAAFAPLAGHGGARLLDLQYGDSARERAEFDRLHPGALTRLPGLDAREDLEALLAAISACERVVTSSNVLAHLAGAIGKPTWLVYLAGREPFHYWVADAQLRSAWYPSVEIVTDAAWTTWDAAFAELRRRLA